MSIGSFFSLSLANLITILITVAIVAVHHSSSNHEHCRHHRQSYFISSILAKSSTTQSTTYAAAPSSLAVSLNYRFPSLKSIHEASSSQTLSTTTGETDALSSSSSSQVEFNSVGQVITRITPSTITLTVDTSYDGSMFTSSSFNGVQIIFNDPTSLSSSSTSSSSSSSTTPTSSIATNDIESSELSGDQPILSLDDSSLSSSKLSTADPTTASTVGSKVRSIKVDKVVLKSSVGFIYAGSSAAESLKSTTHSSLTGQSFTRDRIWRQGASIYINLQGYKWTSIHQAKLELAYTLSYTSESDIASAIGDPNFTGFNSQSYQVHGTSNTIYSIISSQLLQYNALFKFLSTGRCRKGTECFSHPGNYFGAVGVLIKAQDGKVIQLKVQSGSVGDGMKVTIDGEALSPSENHLTIDDVNTIHFSTQFELLIQSRDWTIRLQNSDMFLNQQVSIRQPLRDAIREFNSISEKDKSRAMTIADRLPHGVLGQTWQLKTYPNRWKYIEGDLFDYIVNDGLLTTPTHFNRFQFSD